MVLRAQPPQLISIVGMNRQDSGKLLIAYRFDEIRNRFDREFKICAKTLIQQIENIYQDTAIASIRIDDYLRFECIRISERDVRMRRQPGALFSREAGGGIFLAIMGLAGRNRYFVTFGRRVIAPCSIQPFLGSNPLCNGRIVAGKLELVHRAALDRGGFQIEASWIGDMCIEAPYRHYPKKYQPKRRRTKNGHDSNRFLIKNNKSSQEREWR